MRPALEYASSVWSPIASSTSINKLQVMQNAALRTATGCTQDTNIQHLHDETLTLPIHEHLQLHATQYKQKTQHPSHPLHKHTTYFNTPRLKKPTIFNNGRYTTNIPTYPHTVTTTDIKTNVRHIHTSIVSRHLATRGNNKILRTPSPHNSSSEERLPRLTRRTLANLRTNKSPFLKSYLQKVDSKRWQQGYNPDLAFVSYSIAHLAEKDVMDAIPKTQHRPISIKLNAAIRPKNVPFRRRYNLKKAKWQSYAKEVNNGIANTDPVPENYEKFVNLVRRSSNKNIPRGCRTSYVCGLNDQSKEMYEDYQRRVAEDPFNEDTVRLGDALLDEISEAHRSKWKEMIESTDFTHSSRKEWKTINKLTKDYTAPQQQFKVTADQVAHQLLLNGKGNKLHVIRREKMPRQTVTESNLTSPFLMEDLLHGVKALKNSKAADLDDMLCEQIKHFGEATLRWLLQIMNSILKTHKFPKLWRKSKVIAILKPGKDSTLPKSYRPISLLCHTNKLFERMILNRLNPLVETMIIDQQAGFRPGKSTTGQLLNLTQHIEDGNERGVVTGTVFVDLSAAYDTISHKLLLNKIYRMTSDIKFTDLIGNMLSNRRYFC